MARMASPPAALWPGAAFYGPCAPRPVARGPVSLGRSVAWRWCPTRPARLLGPSPAAKLAGVDASSTRSTHPSRTV
eukprot:8289896-Lingulodinium_polyedra.AAC.1